jgi:hypothetical protein
MSARAGSELPCRALAYSEALTEMVIAGVQRGSVHSVFTAAANLLFPGERLLSLSASTAVAVPNGLRLSAPPGAFPFCLLRPGMPVLLGAQRLHIEEVGCSLDLSTCARWRPWLERTAQPALAVVRHNAERLRALLATQEVGADWWPWLPASAANLVCGAATPAALAEALCGRGPGLTPAGDDMLVGWLAAGWLLYGEAPHFLAACEEIVAVARRRTHLLSRVWLEYAARGAFALPLLELLASLADENEERLLRAARAVLALGASSGRDLLHGLLLGLLPGLLPGLLSDLLAG